MVDGGVEGGVGVDAPAGSLDVARHFAEASPRRTLEQHVFVKVRQARLEESLDAFNEDLPPLKNFILPGGSASAAHCHLARAICRRAERCLISLHDVEPINEPPRHYLNRLSDMLFVFARVLSRRDGGSEILWEQQTD